MAWNNVGNIKGPEGDTGPPGGTDIADISGLQTALDGKVDENSSITGATKTKLTYDAKGLVTAGADAAVADISGLQAALDAKAPLASYYAPGGTDVALADGGTGASLADPNVDRIMFWDDSAGVITWLAPGTGLSITGTSLDASAVTAAFKAVRLNDTGNETYTIVAGTVTQIAGTTIDGVAPAFGDRILISCAPAATGTGSFASNQPANGIYTVTGNTTNITLARASDMSGSETPVGTMVYVRDGNGSGGWLVSCSSPVAGAFTWGTTASQWGYNYATFGYIRNGTFTMANKRITPRDVTVTAGATPSINTNNGDFFEITGLTVAITSMTSGLTGTPTRGQRMSISITGTAARAITWGTSFEASTIALPTTTVTTARLDVGFIWNSVTSKWRVVSVC